MKKIFTVFILLFLLTMGVKKVFAQASTANYAFASAVNGSLTDMTSETTQLIAGNITNGISTLQNIGFDFYYMGIKYTQFGVSSNGVFRFGALPNPTSTNNLTSTTNTLANIIAPFWDALATNSTGGVRYKVAGSAPNRILTVEWFNMEITASSSTANGTFQLRLYETTGKFEFVYGSMNIGAGSGTVTASIGFKTLQANNNVLSVTNITSPAVTTTAASVNNNLVNSSTVGPIAGLNSSIDGNRVIYSFTPPAGVPAAPTNLSFTSVNNTGMTLNWVDVASNESGYFIERSTNADTGYSRIGTFPANSTSYTATGLTPAVTYYWKVYAFTEANFSTSLNGLQTTTSIPPNPPTNLTFTNISMGSLTLNWLDNSGDEINFKIEQSGDGGSTYFDLVQLSPNTQTYTVTGLSQSTTYFWRIYAIGPGNISSAALQDSQSTDAGTFSGLKTIGATGNYLNIKQAFNEINIQGLGGPVVLELQSDYNIALDSPTVNCYGNTSGSGALTPVVIRPASGVTGLVFNSTFVLNGTKYLTIDGRPGGTGTAQEITISNSSVSGNAIRFINDASNNTFKYCKIRGVNTSVSDGVILQSTTTGTTGNDNNTIDNCEIRDGATAPTHLIYNNGTSGKNNDGFTLSNCRVFNFSRAGFGSEATGTGNNYTFTGNSFYQSSSPPASVTSSTTIRGIWLQGEGENHLISGNYFGGQDVSCGGNAFINTGATTELIVFHVLSSVNAASTIQNNVIQNINMTGTGSAYFQGIFTNGPVNIVGNTIGHNSTANSILLAGSSSLSSISSILCNNNQASICANNIIANLTHTGSTINAIEIQSNNVTIMNNTIHTLTGQKTVIGISTRGSATIINNNIIYSIKSLSLTDITVAGISSTSQSAVISKNRIYDLSNSSGGNLVGISATTGGNVSPNYTITNNQISILNNPNTNDITIKGISLRGGKVYYNSVYLGGSISSGSKISSCIYKDTNTVFPGAVFDVRNNIFYNERTGGTGNHYTLDYTNNNNIITSDYNLLVGPASTIARWGTTDYNFADYKTNSGKDGFSLSNQPVNIPANNLFVDKSVGNMNILSANNEAFYSDGKGIPITGQPDDYSSTNIRDTSVTQGTTDIGSDEFDYTGTIPNLTESASPALNTTTTYSFGGRQLASITWGNTGTVPSGITIKYNSGVNPPGTLTGQYSNGYWEITPTGGSGYTYDITLNYSPAILFNIADENNIKIAKRDGGNWDYLNNAIVNTTNKTVTAAGLNSFSQFALTSSDAPLPVELASFTSMAIRNEVILDWSTTLEINNSGFDIERSQVNSSNTNNFQKVGSIQGNGTTNEIKSYKFNDRNVQTGRYKYRLKQIDFNGNYQYFDLSSEVNVGVPDKYDLSQNYPNPFNPVTKINYDMPKDGKVNLRIYDITGREIAALINNEIQPAGYYTIIFNASNLSSGVYFYRLAAGDFVSTKKLVLLK